MLNNDVFKGKKVWITGHNGMLGSAMTRSFINEGAEVLTTSRKDLDLTNQVEVLNWMEKCRPEMVFHIAAKVGGIYANATQPADFLRENLLIQTSVIDGAYRTGVQKLLFVASNCTYPSVAPQPIPETALLTGVLDKNIRSYAIGKIAGIEMCSAYRKQYGCDFTSVIPPNLYGPGDNYHPEHSHVVAGIIHRVHEAKIAGRNEFVVWGDGTPRRELLHVDDLVQAMKHVMVVKNTYDFYNIGCGQDVSISDLAKIIADVVGFEGKIIFDCDKPNGTMRKLLDSSLINSLGWQPKISINDGLRSAYQDYLRRYSLV